MGEAIERERQTDIGIVCVFSAYMCVCRYQPPSVGQRHNIYMCISIFPLDHHNHK
jgi:hypothetical protein